MLLVPLGPGRIRRRILHYHILSPQLVVSPSLHRRKTKLSQVILERLLLHTGL